MIIANKIIVTIVETPLLMKKLLVFTIVMVFIQSCDLLQQAGQMATLTKCEFRLQSVNQLTLAGINVQSIKKFSDLSLIDAGKITASLASGTLPLSFTLNMEAKNPNRATAGITKIDWILLIDGIEMTRGLVEQQVTIPPNNGISVIPVKMNLDLKKALSGQSADAILNFGLNLAGVGNTPTRFTMKLQPTLNVASVPVTYPGYITIGTNFSSGN